MCPQELKTQFGEKITFSGKIIRMGMGMGRWTPVFS
jgi:hypothetical protein